MFFVRSAASAPLPNHLPRASTSTVQGISRLRYPTAHRPSWQGAHGFNPSNLSNVLNISNVTSMDQMNFVRSATSAPSTACQPLATRKHQPHARSFSPLPSHRASLRLTVSISVQPAAHLGRLKRDQHGPNVLCAQRHLCITHQPPATCEHQHHAGYFLPPPSHRASPRLGQGAQDFNEPLAWDVSSVTSMDGMFAVRGTASALLATPPPRASTRCKFCYFTVASPCLAGCTSFQPAACLGRLKRDRHEPDVRGARLFFCTARQPPTTREHQLKYVLLCYVTAHHLNRQDAQDFNQPLAWDVSSVTSMNQMFSVRSAACFRTATQDLSRL